MTTEFGRVFSKKHKTNNQTNKTPPYLAPGHMFAKITSQVREQCRCLLIILLSLQTDSPSVFFFFFFCAAHSFPRQPQIERNKVVGIFHSCLSNPLRWCWNCEDSWNSEYPHMSRAWRSRPCLICLLFDHIRSAAFSTRQEPSSLPFHILMLQDTLKTQRWSKLSRSPRRIYPDGFRERQGARETAKMLGVGEICLKQIKNRLWGLPPASQARSLLLPHFFHLPRTSPAHGKQEKGVVSIHT